MSGDRIDIAALLGRFGVAAPDVTAAVEEAVLKVCAEEGIRCVEVRQRWGSVTVVCEPAASERAVRAKARMLAAAQEAGEVDDLTVRVVPARRG